MKKKELEIILEKIPKFESPKANLEQYSTPSFIASDILFTAFLMNDINNKNIIDLGCGTGIFSLGAKLLGAKKVIGIDIDKNVIDIAKEVSDKLNLEIQFIENDINDFDISGDTIFQNPPFGSQNKHADRIFLEKSLELADVIYTIHLTKTRQFIEKFFKKSGIITYSKNYKFPIKHTFAFHKKERVDFDVTLYRIEKAEK